MMTPTVNANGSSSGAVLFLETQGAGFSANLIEVRNELLRSRPDLELRYVIINTAKDQTVRTHRMVQAACQDASHVICASNSLPANMPAARTGHKRILIQPIRQHMLGRTQGSSPNWAQFTDVVAQSGFVASAVSRELGSSASVRLHATGLPAADRFSSDAATARSRSALHFLAPQAEGRKVIALTSMRKARTFLTNVDLGELAKRLASKYFLMIKAPDTGSVLKRYPATLSEFVLDVQSSMRNIEHLLASDILVSSVFADAVLFSTTRRQVRLLCSSRDAEGLGSLLPKRFTDLTLPDMNMLPESLAQRQSAAVSTAFGDEYAGARDGQATKALVRQLFAR